MRKKIKSEAYKKWLVTLWKICAITFITLLFLRNVYKSIFVSNDFYFLSATGKYIVDNRAIPDTNPFFIFKDKPFVVQQWLYCVYCYFLSLHGNIAVWISIMLFGTILTVLLYNLFRIREVSPLTSWFFSALIISISKGYMLNVRPECITVVLLLLQVYFLEKHQRTGKQLWLMLIPILMLLEINIHSSMWFMHYCLLIPYALPFGFGVMYEHRKSEIPVKSLVLPFVLMMLAMGLNPYGYQIITYTFDAVLSNTFQVITMNEMQPLYCSEEMIVFVLYLMALGSYMLRKQYLRSVSIYICSGLVIMMWLAIRNTMFLPILCFYLFSDFANGFSFTNCVANVKFDKSRIDIVKAFMKKHKSGLMKIIEVGLKAVILVCFAGGMTSCFLSTAKLQSFSKADLWSESTYRDVNLKNTEEIKNFLDSNEDKSIRLFCHINQGGYFESCGYQNVYIDVRPELYHYPVMGVTGNESVLEEYVRLYYKDKNPYSEKEMKEILNAYDFDYLIAESDTMISEYLNDSDMYKEIELEDTRKEGMYHLYEKK